ncbi:MAG TPA: hypothetical protein DC047_09905 [Blastocatellia bacterium]|nr:hypothetical protein [Blastocatellia bacterium]
MEVENQKKSKCTVEADLELLRRSQNGDDEAIGALVEAHYGLINFWVLNLCKWAELDVRIQEGRIGFLEAIKNFDFSRNGSFHELARLRVTSAVYESPEVCPVNRTLYNHYTKVMHAQDELMTGLGRRPTLDELSQKTKLSVKQIDNALNVIAAFTFPLEEADGNVTIEDPYESQLIRDAITKLSSDDADIILRHYFRGQTDREIGEALGKSEDAIKMARKRGVEKLRDIILGRGGQKDGT